MKTLMNLAITAVITSLIAVLVAEQYSDRVDSLFNRINEQVALPGK